MICGVRSKHKTSCPLQVHMQATLVVRLRIEHTEGVLATALNKLPTLQPSTAERTAARSNGASATIASDSDHATPHIASTDG